MKATFKTFDDKSSCRVYNGCEEEFHYQFERIICYITINMAEGITVIYDRHGDFYTKDFEGDVLFKIFGGYVDESEYLIYFHKNECKLWGEKERFGVWGDGEYILYKGERPYVYQKKGDIQIVW